MSYTLASGADDTVREIDQALERVASGLYGNCGECDAAISFLRLRALPTATCCMDCRRKLTRSHEPEPTYAYQRTLR